MGKLKLGDRYFSTYIGSSDIDKAVGRIASDIDRDYASSGSLLFIGVLNGAYMFAADLVRKVTVPCDITFIKVSSYEGLASRGNVTMKLPLNCDIEGRDVIIIDEIVETGLTVDYLFDYLAPMKPRSIAVATLLFKEKMYKGMHTIKYPGITMKENLFVVGYGLDYNEKGRTLEDIYILNEDHELQ